MQLEKVLMTADLHLTDVEIEDYRWDIFPTLSNLALEQGIDHIFILGDLTDRKDRHSGRLLNRLCDSLVDLKDSTGAEVVVQEGNHDFPINSTPYWNILKHLGIFYFTEPRFYKGVWILPYSPNPAEDWKDIDFLTSPDPKFPVKAIMMHQTVDGSIVENNRRLDAPHPMPILPRGIPIYSGDVHRPQQVGAVTYVGAPHPVRFSESWQNRILMVEDGNFRQFKQFMPGTIHRAILDISSTDELLKKDFKRGDQVRVRYHLSKRSLTQWPVEEERIREWGERYGVMVASIEAVLTEYLDDKPTEVVQTENIELLRPDEVIRRFSEDEKLPPEIVAAGLELLHEARQ